MKNKKSNKKNSLGIINVDTAGLVKPILVLTGLGVIAFLIWQTKRSIQYTQKKNILSNSTEKGSTENLATRLKNAMGDSYDGTDEKAIFDVFSEIKTQREFEAVQKDYNKLTNRILMEDLANELTSTEVETLTQNIQAKATKVGQKAPDNSEQFAGKLVELLKKSDGVCDYGTWFSPGACYGSDLDGIFHIFEMIPNNEIYEKVKSIYQTKTGRTLKNDLERYPHLQEYASYLALTNSIVGINSNYNDNSGKQYIIMLQEKINNKFGNI